MSRNVQCFYPEMGQARPEAEIEMTLCRGGKHRYLRTNLTLKGRGIVFEGELTADRVCGPRAAQLVGMKEYRVTNAAFKKIAENHTVSSEVLLS